MKITKNKELYLTRKEVASMSKYGYSTMSNRIHLQGYTQAFYIKNKVILYNYKDIKHLFLNIYNKAIDIALASPVISDWAIYYIELLPEASIEDILNFIKRYSKMNKSINTSAI